MQLSKTVVLPVVRGRADLRVALYCNPVGTHPSRVIIDSLSVHDERAQLFFNELSIGASTIRFEPGLCVPLVWSNEICFHVAQTWVHGYRVYDADPREITVDIHYHTISQEEATQLTEDYRNRTVRYIINGLLCGLTNGSMGFQGNKLDSKA